MFHADSRTEVLMKLMQPHVAGGQARSGSFAVTDAGDAGTVASSRRQSMSFASSDGGGLDISRESFEQVGEWEGGRGLVPTRRTPTSSPRVA